MLSQGQKDVMMQLDAKPLKCSAIANELENESGHLHVWGYDRVHSILRRLEDRNLVRRFGLPARWELTRKGRKELGIL